MLLAVTEEDKCAAKVRDEIRALIDERNGKALPREQRKAEIKRLIQKSLEKVSPRDVGGYLDTLGKHFPHWKFMTEEVQERTPVNLEQAVDLLGKEAASLSEDQKSKLRDILGDAGLPPAQQEPSGNAGIVSREFNQRLGLPEETKVDFGRVLLALLTLVEQLQTFHDTTGAAYNVLKPDAVAEFRRQTLKTLLAEALVVEGDPAVFNAELERFKEKNGLEESRNLLRAAAHQAAARFAAKLGPALNPGIIKLAASRAGEDPWTRFERIAKEWGPQKIKDVFRESIYETYIG